MEKLNLSPNSKAAKYIIRHNPGLEKWSKALWIDKEDKGFRT